MTYSAETYRVTVIIIFLATDKGITIFILYILYIFCSNGNDFYSNF